MFGGAKPTIQNLIASDVEFRLNHVYKPLSWKKGHPTYAGRPWSIKNLFELKNAQRLLIDQNVFENNWADAQNGFAILFTPRGEDGVAPWATVQDVTFTNNVVRHSGGGFNIAGPDDSSPSQPSQRILIKNNLIDDIDGDRWGSATHGPADGRFAQLVGGPVNITFDHNTIFQSGSLIFGDGASSRGFVFRNNIARSNLYGVLGSDRSPGLDSLDFSPDTTSGKTLSWEFRGEPFTRLITFCLSFLVWWDLSIWPEEITALRRPALIKTPAATAKTSGATLAR